MKRQTRKKNLNNQTQTKNKILLNNISWIKHRHVKCHCMNMGSIYYLVAILVSRCGRGIQRGAFPINTEISPAPPHHVNWTFGKWPFVSTWLSAIPNRPYGTLVIWTFPFPNFQVSMQSDLTMLATGISILLQYLNNSLEQTEPNTWTLTATRCENIEEVLKGCCIILECCGQTAFLGSIYKLWQMSSNAMFLFEQHWWPDQPTETSLAIATPPVALKLSALLRRGWREQAHLIRLAMASLAILRDWFIDHFDTELHRGSFSILQDALLVFQTASDMFDLHDAIQDATQDPPPRDDPAEATPDTAEPSAGS